jgi:cytoskeleton protein RodZ
MSDAGSIGQRLRAAREERGITPEQASFRSKVPLQLLYALESDDYHLLPDPAYLIRPLHDYARVLGMDPLAFEEEFRQRIRRQPSPSLAVIPAPEPPSPIPWTQILWTLAAIAVVTPLVFIALSLVSKRMGEQVSTPPPPAPIVEPAASPSGGPASSREGGIGAQPAASPTGVPEPTAPATSPAQPAPGPIAGVPGQAPPPGPPAATTERPPRRLLLAATAIEPTWMRVRADGGEEREVLLQRGQTVRFGAEKGFLVTVGNAGGIELSLNGESLPSLGASGQVIRDLVIPREGVLSPPGGPPRATSAQ